MARLAVDPLRRFLQVESASSIVLLAATAIALGLANSPWAESWRALWQTPIGLSLGPMGLERPLQWFVNDGLMVLFFFVVGLEIRREIHRGELSDWRRAALPAGAALGGMVVPAAMYLVLTNAAASDGVETGNGWAIPAATDIAFAIGVLGLLGKRVPPAMRVLLLALAVIDDLGAIVIIAFFYSDGIGALGIGIAAGGFTLIGLLRAFDVQRRAAYVVPAIIIWAGVYKAGIHPTIAGVAVGLLTPVEPWRRSPADALIAGLHPWVAYGIMPLFALVNAGVSLGGLDLSGSAGWVAGGVAAGLAIGKPLGIVVGATILTRLGWATLPEGVGLRHLVVLGTLAGIGFTMAIFVAELAFGQSSPGLMSAAKLGVLGGSATAAAIGLGLGWRILKPN